MSLGPIIDDLVDHRRAEQRLDAEVRLQNLYGPLKGIEHWTDAEVFGELVKVEQERRSYRQVRAEFDET